MPTTTRMTTRSKSRTGVAPARGRRATTVDRSSDTLDHPENPDPDDGDPDDGPPDPDDPDDDDNGNNDDNEDDPEDPEDPEDPDQVAAEELTKAIQLLAKSVKSDWEKDSARVREPDSFDGSDPKKLRVFLIQCCLNFQAKPTSFRSDSAKVNYALSYLKGTALEWFEPGILSDEEPDWLNDYAEFREELTSNFGPHDVVGDAEDELEGLKMRENQHITKYLTQFNRLAALVDWGPAALRHQFYKGLPTRIKDEVCRIGKPTNLKALRTLARTVDARHWARQEEISRENRAANPARKDKSANKSDKKADSKGESSKPSGGNPNNNAGKSSDRNQKSDRPTNSASPKKPDLSNKLGKDGKLTPEERKRRFENNLCLFCGGSGHTAKECPKSSSSAAKAKARGTRVEKSDNRSDDSKN